MPAFSGAPISIQPALTNGYQPGGVLTPGYYSNLAFQMAGSPQYGPYPAVAPPPDPAGGYGIPSGTSGSGTAGGLLGSVGGALLKNPSLVKSAYNGASGLLGTSLPAVTSPAYDAAITAATSSSIPAATSIAAPTAADVASSIGAPVSGDLYAGAAGAAGSDAAAGAAADTAATAPADTSALGSLGTAAATYALPAAMLALAIFGPTGVPPEDANFVTSLKGMPNLPPGLLDEINNAYGKYGEAGFGQWWAQHMPSAYPNNSPGPAGPNRPLVKPT